MAVEDQADTMYANNRHILKWNGLTEEGGVALLDLTGRIVKFALSRKRADGSPILTPVLDFRSDAVSPQVTIPNPVAGNPHVLVELLPADTAALAPRETDFYFELEVFESDESDPVVVATGTLTIKPNVVNQ